MVPPLASLNAHCLFLTFLWVLSLSYRQGKLWPYPCTSEGFPVVHFHVRGSFVNPWGSEIELAAKISS